MRILTGDDTGLVKIFDIQKSEVLMKIGEQAKGNHINQIVYFNDDNEDSIVSVSQNSTINMYDLDYKEKKSVLQGCIQISEDYDPTKAENNEIVSIHKLKGSDKMLYTFTDNNTQTLQYDREEGNFSDIVNVYKPQNQTGIVKSILNSSQKKLLLIGKKMNPQMIDIETGKQIWKSRNVSNDWLSLQVPIWDVDAKFCQDEKQIYTVTAYQKIRTYDLGKKNCQPLIDFEIDRKKMFEDSPFTSMELSHCKNYMYVSNKLGSIFKLDTRKNFNMVGKMKGSTGSIRQIQMHPTLNYLGSVSIDRYCRVFNENQKIVGKQYLGQKLTTLLFSGQEVQNDEEFEEDAKQKLQANPNLQSQQKTQDDHRENKKKFKDLRKHTIKLEYLNKDAYKNKYKKKDETGFVDEEQNENQQQQQNKKQGSDDSEDEGSDNEQLDMGKYLVSDDDMEEEDIEDIAEDVDMDDVDDDSGEYFDKDDDSDDSDDFEDDSSEEEVKQKNKKNQNKNNNNNVTKKINKQQQQGNKNNKQNNNNKNNNKQNKYKNNNNKKGKK